jgi:hypothetical protein
MELGSYFLFLQEQIKDIIIIRLARFSVSTAKLRAANPWHIETPSAPAARTHTV